MATDKKASVDVADIQTIDHRSGTSADGAGGMSYPFGDDVPEGTQAIEVAEGILWARVPLPWSLDHINVYLFDEGDSWSVVDTGAQGKTGRAVWESFEDTILNGKPISRVIATHMHPDHLGLAGWLVKKYDADFWITQTEYLLANTLWLGAAQEFPENEIEFLFRGGVDRSFEPMIRAAGYGNYRKGVHELPPSYHRMDDGTEFDLGGRRWRVVIGRGHSPEHACLVCLDEPLLIGGDQILPAITSNVSVYAREPFGNPLAHWISSLDRMRHLPANLMVLPSHGKVFYGLYARLDALIEGHVGKLAKLHDRCREPRTTVKTFKALFRRKVEGMDFFLALGEATAHLHLLESFGLLTRSFDGEVYHFQSVGEFDGIAIVEKVNALPGIKMRDLGDFFPE